MRKRDLVFLLIPKPLDELSQETHVPGSPSDPALNNLVLRFLCSNPATNSASQQFTLINEWINYYGGFNDLNRMYYTDLPK